MPASIRSHLTVLVVALAVPLMGLLAFNIYGDTRDAVDQAKTSQRILAIVKRLIERHDGRIWAEAAPGKGATFHLTLFTPPGKPAQ